MREFNNFELAATTVTTTESSSMIPGIPTAYGKAAKKNIGCKSLLVIKLNFNHGFVSWQYELSRPATHQMKDRIVVQLLENNTRTSTMFVT